MNMDQTLIERNGYTIIAILSDIGGLKEFLFSSISLLLGVLNFRQLDSYLVSKLFKSKTAVLSPLVKCENVK